MTVLLVAHQAAERVAPGAEVLGLVRGADLVGAHYTGPFDDLPAQAGVVHRVVAWDQVDEMEGTGIVHIAPGCGAEDHELARSLGLPALAPLREDGTYLDGYGRFSGMSVEEGSRWACQSLEDRGLLHRTEDFTHRYPHCWRCGHELVFRLVGEWFIACDEVRPLMLEAAGTVRWIPEHSGKRMEDWLRNMGDWCISRKRYWGLPLPFYEDGEGELLVVGSRAELRERATDPAQVDSLPELHRPWIDGVEVRTPSGAVARRVAEVGDCWLDAGIVPFSTLGGEGDGGSFERWFPADFVVEMREQIRLWYYSMLFMSVVLDGRAPYRTVMTYEKMADESGEAMHKSAGNAIWFDEAVESAGAEPMRWLFASQNPSLNINFGYGPLTEVKRRFLTLWNTYRFYVQYAELDGLNPVDLDAEAAEAPVDRWLRSRLQALVQTVGGALEEYALPTAVRAVEEFVDDLSNWYVRVNRRRFWKNPKDEDKKAAHATLHEALVVLARLVAPILPFLSEEMYQNLVRRPDPGAPESVHLCRYPEPRPELVDEELMAAMAEVRRVVALGRSLRASEGLKVRQPLARVLVAGDAGAGRAVTSLANLVRQELNVKEVTVCAGETDVYGHALKPDLPALGRRFGARLPAVRAALEAMDGGAAASRLQDGKALRLEVDGERVELQPDEVLVEQVPREGLAVVREGELVVALDTRLDEALVDEGMARDFVHAVQGLRKRSGFALDDRIDVVFHGPESVMRAVERYSGYICDETLCVGLSRGEGPEGVACKVGEWEVRVAVERAG